MRWARREVLRALCAGFGLRLADSCRAAIIPPRLHIDQLQAESAFQPDSIQRRTYRADVVISLLGMSIFSLKNVGSAMAMMRTATQRDQRIVSLQFAGHSKPERAHGVNHSGSMEE